jgi:hypothetical protein
MSTEQLRCTNPCTFPVIVNAITIAMYESSEILGSLPGWSRSGSQCLLRAKHHQLADLATASHALEKRRLSGRKRVSGDAERNVRGAHKEERELSWWRPY